jgi:site-specific DNA recombinase
MAELKPTRIALYARTSTINYGQDVSMQTRELRQYAEARGWKIVGEYSDLGISGAKDRRPDLDRSEPLNQSKS